MVELLPENKVFDLQYVEDIALFGSDAQAMECASGSFPTKLSSRVMWFTFLKCSLHSQDVPEPVPAFTPYCIVSDVVSIFVTTRVDVEETIWRISSTRKLATHGAPPRYPAFIVVKVLLQSWDTEMLGSYLRPTINFYESLLRHCCVVL